MTLEQGGPMRTESGRAIPDNAGLWLIRGGFQRSCDGFFYSFFEPSAEGGPLKNFGNGEINPHVGGLVARANG